jgi:hypothetical protein
LEHLRRRTCPKTCPKFQFNNSSLAGSRWSRRANFFNQHKICRRPGISEWVPQLQSSKNQLTAAQVLQNDSLSFVNLNGRSASPFANLVTITLPQATRNERRSGTQFLEFWQIASRWSSVGKRTEWVSDEIMVRPLLRSASSAF